VKLRLVAGSLTLSLSASPIVAHEITPTTITITQAVEQSYSESFCRTITFTSKIKPKVCKEVVFEEDSPKREEFCAKAVVKKKSVNKCRTFTLRPTNFPSVVAVPTPLPTPNSPDLIPGKDQPEGYLIDLYSSNGQPARWESCREITYSIIGRDNEKRLVKELIPYITEIFGYNFREIDGGKYQPFNENSKDPKISDIYFYFDYDELDVKEFIENAKTYGVASNDYIFDYPSGRWITKGSNIAVRMTSTNPNFIISDNLVRSIILHEVGHAFGLGHTNNVKQMMWVTSNLELQTYQSGDLAGIEFLKNDKSKCTK